MQRRVEHCLLDTIGERKVYPAACDVAAPPVSVEADDPAGDPAGDPAEVVPVVSGAPLGTNAEIVTTDSGNVTVAPVTVVAG
jgi:hypothetical protein